MLKKIKQIMCLTLCFALSFAAFGCGRKSIGIDPNKTQIYVNVYDGGHGTEWAEVLANKWNIKNNTSGYEVIILPEKRADGVVLQELKNAFGTTQAYILSSNGIVPGIYQDTIEDLSDVLAMKVDGEENGTIEDKLLRKDEWYKAYSKNGKGCYALPYADSVIGLIYDHKLFSDNGWYNFATKSDESKLQEAGITFTTSGKFLKFVKATHSTNYSVGDYILTAGHDGKYGTYDDGQPQNETEWREMLDRIQGSGAAAFIWGASVEGYTNSLYAAMFAQYEGLENYNTYFDFSSNGREIKLEDGTSKIITVENGNQVYKMKGLKVAYEFFDKYMNYNNASSKKYMHESTMNSLNSHFDGQNLFLMGYRGSAKNQLSAMLCDGAWWEYEARNMFNSLGSQQSDRGYGKRDYRYMMLPKIDGQVATTSFMASEECGVTIVAKDKDAERLKWTKKFIASLASDESLMYFTQKTGSVIPYKYEINEDVKASMTPFARNMVEMYYDEENITIVRPNLSLNLSPLTYASGKGIRKFSSRLSGVWSDSPIKSIRENSLNAVWEGCSKGFSDAEWAGYIKSAKEQGFFK